MQILTQKSHFYWISKRSSDTYKNKEWHLLILWWSDWMTWALIMASRSASRAWSGLVTVWVPSKLNLIFETTLIEEMSLPLQWDKKNRLSINSLWAISKRISSYSAILIWNWMWMYEKWWKLISWLLKLKSWIPIIIDADWINNLCFIKEQFKNLISKSSSPVVLTPHIWEASRFLWITSEEIIKNQEEITKKYSVEFGVYLVIKGSKITIWTPSWNLFVSKLWWPELATAGSWDVLSWIIGALLSKSVTRWISIEEAICEWVILQSICWKISKEELWEESVMASDLINSIPRWIKELIEA